MASAGSGPFCLAGPVGASVAAVGPSVPTEPISPTTLPTQSLGEERGGERALEGSAPRLAPVVENGIEHNNKDDNKAEHKVGNKSDGENELEGKQEEMPDEDGGGVDVADVGAAPAGDGAPSEEARMPVPA